MIKLDSYVNTGPTTVAITNTLPMADGSVQIHRPFVMLGGGPAITPNVAVDGKSIVIRLDEWHPMWLDADANIAILPMTCTTQDAAAAVARAFAADPAITWSADADTRLAWCQKYVADAATRQAESTATAR